MSEYRIAKPEERDAYIELANYVFSKAHCPHDFETLIPKVYGEGVESAFMHRVAVDEKGKLRAQIAVLPETLMAGGYPLRAGYVGTVSVHPKARGEGHMKILMEDWLKEMRKTCDLAVLGGQRQRYEYFGFTRGGVQVKYTVTGDNIRHALKRTDIQGISFVPLREAEGAAAFVCRKNEERPFRVTREPESVLAIVETANERPLAIKKDGVLAGYLLTGKDGKTIYELVTERQEDLEAAVKAYLAYAGVQEMEIYVPAFDKNLNRCIGRFAEYYSTEPSGMYQIFDFANVLEAYLTLKQNTLGLTPGEFSACLDGQPVTVRVTDAGVCVERKALPGAVVLEKQQAQQLLLSDYGRYIDVPSPAGWFPLPVFWYTADSF
nr:GNAT family N-acetyltransferase [uncultured Eisenbergiella sp.]